MSKYTDIYVKEYKLYNKLSNKISLKIKLLTSGSSGKDRPTLIFISHISISPIQNTSSTCFSLFFLSYKSLFLTSTPKFKEPIIEVEQINNIDSDIKI